MFEKRIDLTGIWELYNEIGVKYEGMVPGCVHTDLFSLEEMFFEKNSEKCRFIEEQEWKYGRSFEVPVMGENPILVFEGLDTYCEIFLNGISVGATDNMFIPHRFEVKGILKQGKNYLEVLFHSPIKAVEGKENLRGAFTTERLHSRRIQCTYGWDWVDRFVTCGIFRPVYIVFEDSMALDNVYVTTNNIDSYSAQIKVKESFSNFGLGCIVKTEVLDPQGDSIYCTEQWCQERDSILYFDIEDPQLWYPQPYGEQPLYTLKITVEEQVFSQKFGIRTIKILQIKDRDEKNISKCKMLQVSASGEVWDQNEEYFGFILVINGTRIYCTGANWVPCEPFPSAETDQKITGILEMALKSGINMIRVWGGGLFEKQHFYDECDRLGIMVTQDFLMACGTYPEKDEEFQRQLEKEAEFAAIYLRNHPCLVWWTGDNENAVRGCDTDTDYKGRTSARKVIAPVLERLDYNRAFLFSSPYGGKNYASKTVGTTHNTQFLGYAFDYIGREDISDYREYWKEYGARFIAEEPCMGAICKESLNSFISPENQKRYDMWLYHTKTNPSLKEELMDTVIGFAENLFGAHKDWEDKYFKLRYLEYEWIRITLGNARSNLWFNSGIIYWMLNDCWPAAIGWSIIDYYNRPKAGYYAMKSCGQSVSAYIEKTEDCYLVHVSNILEANNKSEICLKVTVFDLLTGKTCILSEEIFEGDITQTEAKCNISLNDNEILIAEVRSGKVFQRTWYKEGIPRLEKAEGVSFEVCKEGIEISAEGYVHVVEIEGACGLSDNYFSLLPGEKRLIYCVQAEQKQGIGQKISVNGYSFARKEA